MRTAGCILRVVGVVGFWFWPLLCGIAWAFVGIRPETAQTVFVTFRGLIWFLAPMFTFVYYLCLVDLKWSRRLLVIGMLIHLCLLAAIITLSASTDGGILVTPLLLVGPVAWLVYANHAKDDAHAEHSADIAS
jgi:hypothetical protein